MAIINFSTFSLNAAPLSSDYLVGFRADGTPFYENTLTVDALYTYVSTRFNAASGSYISYSDSFQNVSLPNQLTVTGSIIGGGTIQTNNGSLISKGTTNSVIAYDRTVGSSAYANFYKSSGNNILGDSIAGTVITYTSGGNVGIGTASPNAKLDVNGGVSVRASGGLEGGQLDLYNPDGTNIGLSVDVSVADTGRIFQTRNNSQIQIGQLVGTGGSISFFTNSLERFRLSASDINVLGNSVINCKTTAKAWVNFRGTGTGSMLIRSSYNVSSVVRNAVGDYTINFVNAITDPAVAGSAKFDSSNSVEVANVVHMRRTTNNGIGLCSSIRIATGYPTAATNYTSFDEEVVSVIVFGN